MRGLVSREVHARKLLVCDEDVRKAQCAPAISTWMEYGVNAVMGLGKATSGSPGGITSL